MKYTSDLIDLTINGIKPTGYVDVEMIRIPPPLDDRRLAMCKHLNRDKMTDEELTNAFHLGELGSGERINILLCADCRKNLK